MIKVTYSLALIALISGFFACQKDNGPSSPQPKIKDIAEPVEAESVSIQLNRNGNLSSFSSANPSYFIDGDFMIVTLNDDIDLDQALSIRIPQNAPINTPLYSNEPGISGCNLEAYYSSKTGNNYFANCTQGCGLVTVTLTKNTDKVISGSIEGSVYFSDCSLNSKYDILNPSTFSVQKN